MGFNSQKMVQNKEQVMLMLILESYSYMTIAIHCPYLKKIQWLGDMLHYFQFFMSELLCIYFIYQHFIYYLQNVVGRLS